MSTQSESSGVGGTSDQGRKKGESIEEMLLRLGIEEDVADCNDPRFYQILGEIFLFYFACVD
jgi:hypothetical protein